MVEVEEVRTVLRVRMEQEMETAGTEKAVELSVKRRGRTASWNSADDQSSQPRFGTQCLWVFMDILCQKCTEKGCIKDT